MKVGINTYGCRKVFEEDFDKSLDKLKEIGISSIEICVLTDKEVAFACSAMSEELLQLMGNSDFSFGFLSMTKAKDYIQKIRKKGFVVDTAHIGLPFIRTDENMKIFCADVVDFAKKHGIECYVFSPMKSLHEIKQDIKIIQWLASELKKEGILFAIHNHHMECESVDGMSAYGYMLEECSSIYLEPDLGWMMVGGMEPIAFMKKYGTRIIRLHLKDFYRDIPYLQEGDERFAPIGEGVLELEHIIPVIKEYCCLSEYGLIIDQDGSAGNFLEDIQVGYENITAV